MRLLRLGVCGEAPRVSICGEDPWVRSVWSCPQKCFAALIFAQFYNKNNIFLDNKNYSDATFPPKILECLLRKHLESMMADQFRPTSQQKKILRSAKRILVIFFYFSGKWKLKLHKYTKIIATT